MFWFGGGLNGAIFCDWFSASQFHEGGGLPIIAGGFTVQYDRDGNARFEHVRPEVVGGSWGSGVRVACNGRRVFIDGNVGRFGREDNLFNHGWSGTVSAANRILARCGLPAFTAAGGVSEQGDTYGARVSRIDLTANFGCGGEAQARAVIRWLASQGVKRVRRGQAGDDSVWWANTRGMFKAYRKDVELLAHGAACDSLAVRWARDLGVVRVEVGVRRRTLQELGLYELGDITQEGLEACYRSRTEILRRVDRSDDPDLLASVPGRYRMTAAAWLAGQDVAALLSRATLFRHAKVLRSYGIDIFSARSVSAFPVRVRVVELQPLGVPEWYSLKVVNS